MAIYVLRLNDPKNMMAHTVGKRLYYLILLCRKIDFYQNC